MSANSPSGSSSSPGTGGFPAAGGQFPGNPPPWQPGPVRGQSRGLTFLALALAAVATVLAVVGWFRPVPAAAPAASPAGAPTYTEQQIADAKSRACAAIKTVHEGAILHSGTGTTQSSDPVMAEAQAADGRLAVIAGGWYLRDHLSPATPEPLVQAVQHLSQVMLDLGANYLAGAQNGDPAQAALISDGNSSFKRAQELCK